MEREISAEEATILSCERPKHGINMIDSYYDCKTCAYWLTEAMYQCQEKSCKQCVSSNRRQTINGDYKVLSNGISGCDIRTLGRAADNYEVPKCCDNIVKTPTQLNSPLNELNCVPRLRDGDMIECQFAACGCNFRASDRSQLIVHNEENIHRHMNMMMLLVTKTTTTKDTKSVSLTSTTNKIDTTNTEIVINQNGSNHAVAVAAAATVQPMEIKKLHDRVTTLEQELNNYKNDVKRLTLIINKLSIANLRERSGTLVWEIDDFERKVQEISDAHHTNAMKMFYSPDLYTDPYGYRFCARLSISTKSKVKDTIGLHVHMMQSENDFHLDWPFRGCIQIFMINEDSKLTQRDKIMTNEKSTAFQRPNNEISAHSFGFTEYANISSIINDGFLSSDGKLTIKLHISIV